MALAWKKNGDKRTECLGTADTGRDREGGVVDGGKKREEERGKEREERGHEEQLREEMYINTLSSAYFAEQHSC